jgi:hypothetical protein
MKWNDPSDYDDLDHRESAVILYGFVTVLLAACVVLAALWLWLPR